MQWLSSSISSAFSNVYVFSLWLTDFDVEFEDNLNAWQIIQQLTRKDVVCLQVRVALDCVHARGEQEQDVVYNTGVKLDCINQVSVC